ncbi:MAG: ABC transporter permease [Actinomycetota bacterium]
MQPENPRPIAGGEPSSGAAEEESSDFQETTAWGRRAAELSALAGAVTEEEFEEVEQTRGVIPHVRPLTGDDLDLQPPPRQRYLLRLGDTLRKLLGARELIITFVERDLRVRYKQAALGAVWAVLQPLMMMVVFTLVFGRIAKVGSEGLPYAIFAYCALVPWQLFSGAITYGTNSIITNAPIVRKIAMPREVFPVASLLSAGVDFAVSTVILAGMLVAFGFRPRLTWIAYPLLLVILMIVSLAVTMFISAVTVYFRDTRYGIPMLIQIGLYATPVAYPIAKLTGPDGVLHGAWAAAYPYLNPLAPLMDGFRRILAHGTWPDWEPVGAAALLGVAALMSVYWWYKRLDRTFADVI